MNSREKILRRLRAANVQLDATKPDGYLPTTPLDDHSADALRARFIEEAQLLQAVVHQVASPAAAVEQILALIGDDKRVLCWSFAAVGLEGLEQGLRNAAVEVAAVDADDVRVGITGVDAALAATGSIVLISGEGKPRSTSLLPTIHIAVVRSEQIVAHFEAWVAQQRADNLEMLRNASNTVVISGASRTADIAMELILGMHGPGELHIVLLPAA